MSGFHIASILIFTLLAVLYWFLAGRHSTYFYKSNLALVILWGVAVGWITGDFLYNARHK